jgi:hypothetical protein
MGDCVKGWMVNAFHGVVFPNTFALRVEGESGSGRFVSLCGSNARERVIGVRGGQGCPRSEVRWARSSYALVAMGGVT